jgi:hypothetical protein
MVALQGHVSVKGLLATSMGPQTHADPLQCILANPDVCLQASDICKIILAIFVPPLGVFLERGCVSRLSSSSYRCQIANQTSWTMRMLTSGSMLV